MHSTSPYFFEMSICLLFFFNDTATTEIYTLSLHDALPISRRTISPHASLGSSSRECSTSARDRKSTRLNSSHRTISYAVFYLKKKKKISYQALPDYQCNTSEMRETV